MKLIKKIVSIVLIVFIVAYASICVFLAVQGKRIVTDQLNNAVGRQVTIGSVRMSGLWTFKIVDVQIDGIGKAASVDISPSLLGFMTGKMVFFSIVVVKPELTYINTATQQPESAGVTSEQVQPEPAKPQQVLTGTQACPRSEFIFHQLRVIDGIFVYFDQTVSSETGGIKITATNVDATVINTYQFPKEIVTKFTLSADIPWKDSPEKGVVKLDGWMNYDKKDMRAMLEMKDIDALYLYPYYSGWFSLDRSSIQKAKLAFTSNVTGLNNDVTAACHIELTELSFKPREETAEQTKSERFAQKVLQFFKAMNDGKVNLDFAIKTKMDSPEFGLNCIKNAFYSTLTQARKNHSSAASKVAEMPGQVVGGTVKGVSDISSALIGGVVSVGREIGKSLGASFKREPAVSHLEPVNKTSLVEEQKPAELQPAVQQPVSEPLVNETANNTTTEQ